jgi:hypothetical protein
MNKSCTTLCIAFFLLSIGESQSQNFQQYEDSLKLIAPEILNGLTDAEKAKANSKFISLLSEVLKQEGSFKYPFDSLFTIARLQSDVGSFRIFNWNLPKEDGTYLYFGIIQRYNKKSGLSELFLLKDKSNKINLPEIKKLSNNNWYGAHYYDLAAHKWMGKTTYTLLGWDGNTRQTTKKVVDILYFDKVKGPLFGKDVFEVEGTVKHRVIFEYSSMAVMSLKFEKKNKMIVFDNLGSIHEGLAGMPQFNGPDGSYNALRFKRGKWRYIQDYDARNSRSVLNAKKYNPPK